MSKTFCMNCKKEVSEDVNKCECGGVFFVYGDKFHFEVNGITCNCGNDKFSSNLHMDYKDKAVTNFNCTKCSNLVVTENYRDKDDLMYVLG